MKGKKTDKLIIIRGNDPNEKNNMASFTSYAIAIAKLVPELKQF